jgi:hypothetical protein
MHVVAAVSAAIALVAAAIALVLLRKLQPGGAPGAHG